MILIIFVAVKNLKISSINVQHWRYTKMSHILNGIKKDKLTRFLYAEDVGSWFPRNAYNIYQNTRLHIQKTTIAAVGTSDLTQKNPCTSRKSKCHQDHNLSLYWLSCLVSVRSCKRNAEMWRHRAALRLVEQGCVPYRGFLLSFTATSSVYMYKCIHRACSVIYRPSALHSKQGRVYSFMQEWHK
jgi:hypothetical protein